MDADQLDRQITSYISNIKHNAEVEVEYKITKCNKQMFTDLLVGMKQHKDKCKLTQTTAALFSEDDAKNNIKATFIILKDYGTNTITKHRKQRILDTFISDFDNIKLSISLEYTLDKNATQKSNKPVYRIKNRLSFDVFPWRYDFTQVIMIDPTDSFNNNTIKTYSADLFDTFKGVQQNKLYDAYIKSCDNIAIRSFEVEIELIDRYNKKYLNDKSFLDGFSIDVKAKLYYYYFLSLFAKAYGYSNRSAFSMKNMLPKAESLTKLTYNYIYPPVGYYISYKADGDRAMLLELHGDSEPLIILLTSNDMIVLHGTLSTEANNIVCALEGEYIGDKIQKFLAYDCMILGNEGVFKMQFRDRLAYLNKAIVNYTKKKYTVAIEQKDVRLITDDLQKSFKSIVDDGFPYKNDGFILTEPDKDYESTHNYKIKEHDTIDFLAIKIPDKYYGNAPYKVVEGKHLYLLFSASNVALIEKMCIKLPDFWDQLFKRYVRNERIPVQFCPSDNPLAYLWYVSAKLDKELQKYIADKADGKNYLFVELEPIGTSTFDKSYRSDYCSDIWCFHRIRDDRYNEPNFYGNDFLRVAVPAWLNSYNKLTIAEMHMPVTFYFAKGKSNEYFAQTSLISFAKNKLIKLASDGLLELSVIDFAAGKGQDLNRYIAANYTKGLFIDIDQVALSELVNRWLQVVQDKRKTIKMKLGILHRDLSLPATETLELINKVWIDDDKPITPTVIVCNLAIHYIITDMKSLTNFCTLLNSLLPKGGRFLYTTFDGAAIMKILDGKQQWVAESNGVAKYQIIKQFEETQLGMFGQTIKVKLPFTGEELYTENLFNIEFVNEAFEKMGLKVKEIGHMDDFAPLFRDENKQVYNQLTDDDKTFVGLYAYCIIEKL